MSDVKDLTQHNNYSYRNAATDDFYNDIIALIDEYAEHGLLTYGEIVGAMEWAKTTLIISNTEIEEIE